jgi:hypothetical protein
MDAELVQLWASAATKAATERLKELPKSRTGTSDRGIGPEGISKPRSLGAQGSVGGPVAHGAGSINASVN